MKKSLLVFLFVTITGLAFSADFKMSLGGGVFYNRYFGMGGEGSIDLAAPAGSIETVADLSYGGFGGFMFFDATYVVASLSYATFHGGGNIDIITKDNSGDVQSRMSPNSDFQWSSIEIGLMGKYPFTLGRFTIFPLLGAYYEFVLNAESAGVSVPNPKDGNTLVLQGGVGTDFYCTESIFIRGEALFLVRVPSQSDRDAYDGGSPNFGKGIRIKLSVGYTF